ncbi:MAG TPA: SCO1664 family protein, partial [Candidatus Saccharimonadales bacterium]|nr:SCO1664 family protein [Candidatus Saccharimonadales bacterium]
MRAQGDEDDADPNAAAERAGSDLQREPGLTLEAALELLRSGELDVQGRLIEASNLDLYCTVTRRCADPEPDVVAACVYKPIRGERPLDDFPDGTLAYREAAAHVVSEATGWDIVPPTIIREGPLGLGMVQLWIDVDETVDVVSLIREGHRGLRRMAVFDAVVNNADRKGGHMLPTHDGHIFGVDHGICFSPDPKLRTILWGWRGTT